MTATLDRRQMSPKRSAALGPSWKSAGRSRIRRRGSRNAIGQYGRHRRFSSGWLTVPGSCRTHGYFSIWSADLTLSSA